MSRQKLPDDPTLPQGFSATFRQRFWSKVNKTESCWLWTGAISNPKKPYGSILTSGHSGPLIGAHVASWIIHFGPVPQDKWVLHNCPGGDNSLCVNPSHLWLGDACENNKDMRKKHRDAFGDRQATKLSLCQVVEIIKIGKDGKTPHPIIAKAFGVSRSHISSIIRGKCWSKAVHLGHSGSC